jgi:hypothetical protein
MRQTEIHFQQPGCGLLFGMAGKPACMGAIASAARAGPYDPSAGTPCWTAFGTTPQAVATAAFSH